VELGSKVWHWSGGSPWIVLCHVVVSYRAEIPATPWISSGVIYCAPHADNTSHKYWHRHFFQTMDNGGNGRHIAGSGSTDSDTSDSCRMPLDTRVNCLRTTILTIFRHRSQLISLLGSCSSAMALLRLKYCVIRIRTICDNISSTSTSYRWHQHRASVPIIATLWIKTCQHFVIPIKINTVWNLRRPGLPYRHSCQSSGLGDTRSCHHSQFSSSILTH